MNLEIYQQLCAESNSLDTALFTANAGKRYQSCRRKKWNCNRRNHRGLSRYKEI